jgi:hypothetical protein
LGVAQTKTIFMKKLLYLFLMSLTSMCYSQSIGVTSAPHKLGAGIFYNSNELGKSELSIYEAFDYGRYHSPLDQNYILIKFSTGLAYAANIEAVSKFKFIGAICFNDITPSNPNVSEFSMEIGAMLYSQKISYIMCFDFVNQDVKIGIGFIF